VRANHLGTADLLANEQVAAESSGAATSTEAAFPRAIEHY